MKQRHFFSRGFTLIEMLVALAVGASISVLAYQALNGAIATEARVTEVTTEIEAIDRTWKFLGEDLQHAVARPWVDQFKVKQAALFGLLGDRQAQSSSVSTGNDSYLLRFVRSGRQNIFSRARSDLEIVAYRITQDDSRADDDSDAGTIILWRDHWGTIDSVAEPDIKSRRLLEGVKAISFRYLAQDSASTKDEAWLTGWPRSLSALDDLPIAVEVSIELNSLGVITRIFQLVEDAS